MRPAIIAAESEPHAGHQLAAMVQPILLAEAATALRVVRLKELRGFNVADTPQIALARHEPPTPLAECVAHQPLYGVRPVQPLALVHRQQPNALRLARQMFVEVAGAVLALLLDRRRRVPVFAAILDRQRRRGHVDVQFLGRYGGAIPRQRLGVDRHEAQQRGFALGSVVRALRTPVFPRKMLVRLL